MLPRLPIRGSGMIHGDVVQVTGRPSHPQIGALLARRVHRLEVLMEPTNLTTGGVAVQVGLHHQPARAALRGLRVVTLVDHQHRSEHSLGTRPLGSLAKLSDITLMSAAFGGERVIFEPWVTLLVDHGRGAFLTGVYRSDSASSSDAESDGPRLPIWCLRKSEWLRQTDLEQSSGADDLSEYLSSGPQVTNRLVFTKRIAGSRPAALADQDRRASWPERFVRPAIRMLEHKRKLLLVKRPD